LLAVRSALAVVLLAVTLLVALPGHGVFAHAELSKSEPPNGGTLATTPAQLTLYFSQNLVANQSWVAIRDAAGGDIQLAVTVDASDRKVMRAMTPVLQPGVYTIRWQSLSADDDDFAQGSYKLTVLNPDGSRPPGNEDNTGIVLAVLGVAIVVMDCGFGVRFMKRRKHEAV
jgi:methionine-rich copper-binding protein CopC